MQLFNPNNPVQAAANATILLAVIAVAVVPYLIYTNRTEKAGR